MRSILVSLVAAFVCVGSASAFQNASDDASDAVYDDGWQNGDNGGSGWNGGWQISTFVGAQGSAASHDVSSSTANGGGDVDTGGRAFHLSASGNGETSASRYFASPLAVGETVSADLDEVGITGSVEDLDLGGSGPVRLRVGALTSFFYVTDLAGSHSTGIAANGDPVSAQITLTGADTYSAKLTPLLGAPVTISGTLAGSGAVDYVSFDVYQPGAATRQMFFNRITVPEPTRAGLEVAALAPLAFLTRRARRERRQGPGRDADDDV